MRYFRRGRSGDTLAPPGGGNAPVVRHRSGCGSARRGGTQMAFSWKLYGDGKTPPLGEAVAPDERLSWPRTVGIGAQHVVAMFGATFVFPIIMGLDANLAIMMSGVATIVFLLIVNGRVPSYLGTSASFVGGVGVIAAQDGGVADKTGAILIAGVVLALVGLAIHFAGVQTVNK